MKSHRQYLLSGVLCIAAAAAGCAPLVTPAGPVPLAASAPPPGGCEVPVDRRTSAVGCYLAAEHSLPTLPPEAVFWHIDEFATHAAAARARDAFGTVVTAFNRNFLYTIAPANWRPSAGTRVAVVGPLGHQPGTRYVARYMEGTFEPGMLTTSHRHAGVEAWYVLDGAQCLETPDGVTIMRAGEGATVAAGPPMVLRHMGREQRRSIVLVLHPAGTHWITRAPEWTPAGRCPARD